VEHRVIYRGMGTHSAFPSIIRLHDGDLLIAFREAPVRADTRAEPAVLAGAFASMRSHYHLDPGSEIVLVRSRDDGATWPADARTVVCPASPDRDRNYAMLTQLRSGDLLVNQHRWFVFPARAELVAGDGDRGRFEALCAHRRKLFDFGHEYAPFGAVVYDGMYLLRSRDAGRSWSEDGRTAFGPFAYMTHSGTCGGVYLPDGELLLPLHGCTAADRNDRVFLVRSRDDGRTWSPPIAVAYDPDGQIGFHEPSLERLPDGRLVMVLRTDGADGFLYRTFSDDDGWTWQGLERTPLWGHPAHLLALADGRLLCAYGYRRDPFGVRACVSADRGLTWDVGAEVVLRADGKHRDLGYPNSIQLRDGRVMTTYYIPDADNVRHIAATVWRPS